MPEGCRKYTPEFKAKDRGRDCPYGESGKNWGCDVRSHVVSDCVEEVG
jgi:hypothetical protein